MRTACREEYGKLVCYACTQCGKCGKFGEGENLASMITIPCLKCGAVVSPFNGICTECGHRAFVPVKDAVVGKTRRLAG